MASVCLINPPAVPRRNGPMNGMYALRKELERRIADGLSWLRIAGGVRPLTRWRDLGDILWFWSCVDRTSPICACNDNRPIILGPNVLFMNWHRPGIDAKERALLNAHTCVAMFCHSERYARHIAAHRGPRNTAPFFLWPYPVDPLPPGPTTVEYDLLVYIKSGVTDKLLRFIDEKFPNNIKLRYGSFRRDQLYEAAPRCRACVYISIDDHGPIASQEIVLAGCPIVAVRDICPLLENDKMGIALQKLPQEEDDDSCFATLAEAVNQAMLLDREEVRETAKGLFTPTVVGDKVVSALETIRHSYEEVSYARQTV